MRTEKPKTRNELLATIEHHWVALNLALDRLDPNRIAGQVDEQGWTVQDHLAHLAAWEQSVEAMLDHRPRADGLGVSQELYDGGDIEAINAAIQRQHQGLPLSQALLFLRRAHQQLMAAVEPLSEAELRTSYAAFYPPLGEGDDRPIMDIIYANTAEHFAEHLTWMEALAAGRE
jgi:hypothetical protein